MKSKNIIIAEAIGEAVKEHKIKPEELIYALEIYKYYLQESFWGDRK